MPSAHHRLLSAAFAALAILRVSGTLLSPIQMLRQPLQLNRADLRAALDAGINRLYDSFSWDNGLFGGAGTDGATPFWTTANAFETTFNYMEATGDVSPLSSTNGSAPLKFATYLNWTTTLQLVNLLTDDFRDDHLWWVLALVRATEVTGEPQFLSLAQNIYGRLVGPWHAWNASCGGVAWAVNVPYINAITNELFLSASMALARTTSCPSCPVANYTYLGWAQREWSFLNSSQMLQAPPALPLYQDGLSETNCSEVANGAAIWTYNQGALLSGLVFLGSALNRSDLVDFAADVADAAMAYFGSSSNGVLVEFACGPTGNCSGLDGQQFKGVLLRHMAYMLPSLPKARAASLAAAAALQASSILANSTVAAGVDRLQFGLQWQGPFFNTSYWYVAQGSALDALLAAYAVA